MVPFDDKSPFVTSGIRIGTPAITTRGLKEQDMAGIADLIDAAVVNASDSDKLTAIGKDVHEMMSSYPLFQW